MTDDDLTALKEELSVLAVRIGREHYGITLDYSNDSIRGVDKILGEVHNEFTQTGSDEGLSGIAWEFAAYIVKVIEKNVQPVRWERNHPEIGEDSFPLYLADEEVVFPVGWCQKRIFDGAGDDVWTKYNLFILKRDPPIEEKKGFLKRIFGSGGAV